jgi:hypothetical protein
MRRGEVGVTVAGLVAIGAACAGAPGGRLLRRQRTVIGTPLA